METADILNNLQESDSYKGWKENHPDSFLSHFFCPLDANLETKSPWEIGLFDSAKEKITVFVVDSEITMKYEDEVFKKKEDKVEGLNFADVKISFKNAKETFKVKEKELFPSMIRGDGFVVLQTIDGKTLWNFTSITKQLKFVNIKINAQNGEVDSHTVMDLIDKQ